MAKLFHILAASVGSGLVLGASIRLGEAIGSSGRKGYKGGQKPAVGSAGSGPSPEWQSVLADVIDRVDRQQSDVEAIRHQVGKATRALDAVGDIADGLRHDLHRQLSDDLDQRLAAVEEKLHLSLKAANCETVSAMMASIETHVGPRISRLETEINDQAAVVAELRECSLQSERSILRLLTVIERTVNPRSRTAEPTPGQGQGAPGQVPSEPAGALDSSRTDLPKLSVVTSRGQEEPGTGTGGARRPASFR